MIQMMNNHTAEYVESKAKEIYRRYETAGSGTTGFDEEEFDSDMDMNLGGPESVINLDINNERDTYLNPKHFSKYEYSFGEETSLNGERLVA